MVLGLALSDTMEKYGKMAVLKGAFPIFRLRGLNLLVSPPQ